MILWHSGEIKSNLECNGSSIDVKIQLALLCHVTHALEYVNILKVSGKFQYPRQ